VKTHNSATSCWAAVDKSVYDLTAWVSKHPGGSSVIKALCGTDATAAFHDEHSTEAEPNSTLKTFRLGALAQG
jgi:cytochrome b involved in lipid metabolism